MKVLISDKLSEKGIEILKGHSDISLDINTDLSQEELIKCIGEYDALLVRSKTKVTRQVIEAAKRLKIIGRAGVGVDNIDLEAASQKGIIVMNTPGGNTISAAEHAMSLLLALARNIPQAHQSLKQDKWEKKRFLGTELYGKVLGIIGLGRIGSEVARRALSFGMKIIAADPYVSPEYALERGVRLVSIDDLFSQADFISLHMPSSIETRHLINKAAIAKFKEGIRLINCARGDLIDEEALVEGLKDGRIKGAALDVFEKEPPHGSPLLNLENVILTPHIGSYAKEARIRMEKMAVENLLEGLAEKGLI